ncbi:MAG: methyltransferase domain-containing protein [Acidimicrobiia bacterium]|nr:methyltransferase domain-containing protein [Acidimicrobiia bacterium]MYC46698.1 methyltransferase domain-containing protein [Acidimicrobiia bacterium]MYI19482.1 methyltransferase domain-containing protein [Acidimicrobiia bacterium]
MDTVDYRRLELAPGHKVLDLGCGSGRHAFGALRRGAEVVACDLGRTELAEVRDMVAAMRDAGEMPAGAVATTVGADARRLPFADGGFDRIIAAEVLEHVDDDGAALAELARVLRPGGVLAVTVPSWLPEKLCWLLSEEYHAPAVVGGHIRIYTLRRLRALLRGAGLLPLGRHRAHALHSPYWWLRCAVGPNNDDHRLVRAYHRLLCWEIERRPLIARVAERLLRPLLGKSVVLYAVKDRGAGGGAPGAAARVNRRIRQRAPAGGETPGATATYVREVPGLLSRGDVTATAEGIVEWQLDSGLILWFPGGHADPWNHVECAMALDVTGYHAAAERAYDFLAATQRRDGAWHRYYTADGVEEHKLDANCTAYVACGVWHHYLMTRDRGFLEAMWRVVERAVGFTLDLQQPRGEILWARHADGTPWPFALLSSSSSIHHSLRSALAIAAELGHERPRWETGAARLAGVISRAPDAFAPKDRFAMDWYYPVLAGILEGDDARRRLLDRWDDFVLEGWGVRCVADRDWVTPAETAECTLACLAAGLGAEAWDLFGWSQRQRDSDGRYWTGTVLPQEHRFPAGEKASYSAAAQLLAADALTGATAASGLFTRRGDPAVPARGGPSAGAAQHPQ